MGKREEDGLIFLSNDYTFYGLLMFFGNAIKAKDAASVKKVTELLRRIRVTFHHCVLPWIEPQASFVHMSKIRFFSILSLGQNVDAAQRLRWSLEQKLQNNALNSTLRGFKRILGFVEVKTMLQNAEVAHDEKAVADWLGKAGVPFSYNYHVAERICPEPNCIAQGVSP